MSTCAGHSDAHALHPRQSSRASWRPSSARPAARLPSRAARRIAARPARGVPLVAERLEARAHRARAGAAGAVAVARLARPATSPPSAAKSIAVPGARRGGEAGSRRPSSIGSGSVSTPGLSTRSGSRRRFSSANASMRLRRVHPRQQLAAQAAVAVLARERAAVRGHQVGDLLGDAPHAPPPRRAARRSISGRMWRQPTLAWPYQTAGIPSRASTAAHRAGEPGEAHRGDRRVLDERRAAAGRRRRRRPRRAAPARSPSAAPPTPPPARPRRSRCARRRSPRAGRGRPPASPLCSTISEGLDVGGEAHHGAHRRRAVGGVEQRRGPSARSPRGPPRGGRRPPRGRRPLDGNATMARPRAAGRSTRRSSARRVTASVPSEPHSRRGQSGASPPSASSA